MAARAPYAKIETGAQVAKVDYKGVTYPMRQTFTWDLRSFLVSSKITDGAQWDFSNNEFRLFQNMTRACFRANVCAEGMHPGFFQLGFGHTANSWNGIVICSTTAQPEVPE
jgi:hypothetical protein